MDGKTLATAMHSGQRVFGTAITSPSPLLVKVVRDANLDFVMLDTEHVAQDRQTLSWMCTAYAASGIAPIVRIPSPDPYQAVMALDGGATGIIAPYVESPNQVRELSMAIKQRPIKGLRAHQLAQGDWPSDALRTYVNQKNAHHVLVINTESVPAIDALEELVQIPGLDSVLIGPNDLTCSLGVPEQYDSDEFKQAARTIFTTARQHDVGAGIHYWGTPADQIAWIEAGANMLVHASDLHLFAKHLPAELNAIRAAVGESEGKPLPPDVVV